MSQTKGDEPQQSEGRLLGGGLTASAFEHLRQERELCINNGVQAR